MTTESGRTYVESLAPSGVIADSSHVPQDTKNRDWLLKLSDDTAAGGSVSLGTPLYEDIADAIVTAKAQVDATADRPKQASLPAGDANQSHYVLRYLEAVACSADGTPTTGEYPLLAAEIPQTSDTVANVAVAVLAEVAATKSAWVPIIEAQVAAKFELDSCETQDEIDAVLADIEWPS